MVYSRPHFLFQFDFSGLSGPEIRPTHSQSDGGVLIKTVSSDWFVQARDDARVTVIVNDVRSRCPTGDCVYEYSENTTPTVTGVDPTFGKCARLHVTMVLGI